MGWRFHKSVKIAPGVRLNLSKRGPGLSFGGRGMRYSVGPGGRRTTFSIPGTGLSYVRQRGARLIGRSAGNLGDRHLLRHGGAGKRGDDQRRCKQR